jgi:phosphatidylserine/phosphatidylglycerophosphate/cardiolipin synthase-like enzyme
MFSFKIGEHKNSYPDRIASHLVKAAKRGVKVFVVLETTGDKSDELNIQNRKAGKFLAEKGINVFFDSPRKTTHTKLVVIDQHLIFLGSHNFTQSALKYNNEISVLLDRPDMARNVRNYILKIIKEGQ